MLKLSDFKAVFKDGARPNRFLVSMNVPSMVRATAQDDVKYLCKGAQLPSRDIGQVEIKNLGMSYKVAGDQLYDDVNLTFYNDYDWRARSLIEAWMDSITQVKNNNRAYASDYLAEGMVTIAQLGRKENDIVATYTLFGAYPKQMTSIDLAMDSTDQIEEFSVTFAYAYWTRSGKGGGGELVAGTPNSTSNSA